MKRCPRGMVHLDPSDPDDIVVLTKSGLIWRTPYEAFAYEVPFKGKVQLDQCRNMPDDVRQALAEGGVR